MIRCILILDRRGRVLINRAYDEVIAIEHDLVGSFLIALTQFGNEMFSDQVQEILFSKMQIQVRKINDFYIVGITDLGGNTTEMNQLLTGISEELIRSHNKVFTQSKPISKQAIDEIGQLIDHNVKPFRTFEEKMIDLWDQPTPEDETKLKAAVTALNEKKTRIKKLESDESQESLKEN